MVRVRDLNFEGISRSKLLNLIYTNAGIGKNYFLELMEKKGEHTRYVDYYYRIFGTCNLLFIGKVGPDTSLLKVAFVEDYFKDEKENNERMIRISKKYGLPYSIVFSLSDSEEIICEFLKRIKSAKRNANAIQDLKFLSNEENSLKSRKKRLTQILGHDISKRTKIMYKSQRNINCIIQYIIRH